jgi:hypothetical protein
MPRPQPAPAPEDFWAEAREYHDELWAGAPHRKRFLHTAAAEAWIHRDEADAAFAVASVWRGRRFVGGTILGTLNITTMRVAEAAAKASDAPVGNAYFVYVLPKAGTSKEPALSVNRTLYTPRELAAPSTPSARDIRLGMLELWSGLHVPEIADYEVALAELAIGASGEHSVAPPQ